MDQLLLIIGVIVLLACIIICVFQFKKRNKKVDITITDDNIKPNKFELLDVLLYRYNNEETVFPFKIAVVRNLDDNKVYLIDQKDFKDNLKLGCTWGSKVSYSNNKISLSGDFKLYIKKHDVVLEPENEIQVNFHEKGTLAIKGYYENKKIISSNIYPAYKPGTYPYKESVTYYNCNKDFDIKLIDEAIFVDANLEFDIRENK